MTPTWMPQGTVYGSLLNFQRETALWAERMAQPPYKAPPQAPVLYIKTANTFTPSGARIAMPAGTTALAVGATVGLVMGAVRDGCARPDLASVAGAVLLNDWCVPHDSYFRPAVKTRCVDGLLGVGGGCVPLAQLPPLASWQLEVRINGVLRQTVRLADLVRPAAQLLADVGTCMTLRPGDVLMLGTDCLDDGSRPLAQAGDTVEVSAPGLQPVVNSLVGASA